jgi:ribosomal protein S18 acetylase RimI-like enzyme
MQSATGSSATCPRLFLGQSRRAAALCATARLSSPRPSPTPKPDAAGPQPPARGRNRHYARRVDTQSLGYQTDLAIRALESSLVDDRGDYLVIRTPRNPTFWWGNFLLIPELRAGQAAGWLDRFAAEFPDAAHTAIGVDQTDSAAIEPAELTAAGLEFSSNTVLTASELTPPARPNAEAVFRALDGDDDWQQAARLRAAVSAGQPGSEPEFLRAKLNAERAMTERGRGFQFGAFLDGELAAQLGVVPEPTSGLARYQNVETHPDRRRRGLAGTLVWHAGRAILATGQVKTLVIVAEPAADAIRVYRSAGFAETQDQLSFTS